MKSYLTISVLIVFGLLLTACEKQTEEQTTSEASTKVVQTKDGEVQISNNKLKDLSFVKLSPRDFPRLISTTGYIDVPPANKASINALMGGYVKEFSLMEGQEVTRGSLLLTLENTEFIELQQEYLEVVEQLKYLESDYQRQQIMFEENISSRKNFLKSQSEFKSSVARANGLREKLRMLNLSVAAVERGIIKSEVPIYSPISGIISNVSVTRGSYVSPTQSLAQIINNQDLLLELRLFERDILSIEKGQEVRFTTPEISQEFFTATVSLVGRSINPESRTILVHAELADSLSSKFAAGMFVNATIQGQVQKLQSLPLEALHGTGDNAHVMVIKSRNEDHTIVESVAVERGEVIDEFVEIRNPNDLKGKEIILGNYDMP